MNVNPLQDDGPRRGLFTDLYQLTMGQGYFELGCHDKRATFNLFFRSMPYKGGYAVACGIQPALDYLSHFGFTADDIAYLDTLGLFSGDYLEYLSKIRFTGDVEGVREGTIVFHSEPLLQVTAPLIEAQLVETALLNIVNFSTLIATKAARVVRAARDAKVVDFGLRRAQGDGAYLATRASLVAGAVGTSFVDAGRLLDAKVVGTHAHSWVQMFNDELAAFRAYSKVFPDNCILLLDTYDVLRSGVPNAIKVARELRASGKELRGVRIDSGDLAYLAYKTYKAFYEAGFPDITIVLSSDLDEHVIESIIQQVREGINDVQVPGRTGNTEGRTTDGQRPETGRGDDEMNDVNEGRKESMPDEKRLREATIKHLSFGVGTRMITGGDQAALGGVYKLVAIDDEPRIKVSETAAKTINPGIKRVFRVTDQDGWFLADVLALRDEQPPSPGDWIYHPSDPHARYRLDEGITAVDLLETLMEKGRPSIQIDPFSIEEGRNRLEEQFRHLHPTYQRLLNPHVYKVSLTERLKALKDRMIREFSGKVGLP